MMKRNAPFICAKNLTVGYGDSVIIDNASFTINPGDIFVIMGMSGCGKSTIMRSLIGLNPLKSGQVLIDGVDMWAASPDERREIMKTFGISYQSGALFSSMTLFENVALPMEMETNMTECEIKRAVREKLHIVGLDKYADLYPSEVSGGMIKRAALARAMALNPLVLFFDEPSAGLDPIRSAELDDLIRKINLERGTTIVMVTHELSSIMNLATNGIYICNKTVGAAGAPQQILSNTKNKEILDFLTRNKGGLKK